MNKLHLAFAAALTVTLAACVPATVGVGTLNPLVAATVTTPAQAIAGQTVYVQYTYPKGYFTLSDRRFDLVSVGASSGTARTQESPAFWLAVTVTGLPAGWQVGIAEAAVRKEVISSALSGDMVGYRYYRQLRVVYRVTVPAGASGSEVALLKFKDGNDDMGEVPLVVTVGAAGGPSVGAQF